ncbi:hypothetical protein [Rhodococcus opacus]|uniref:hypothetical protein n=1 Tax=Rhodococcus opacus TaxID=37919 RepID=UPI00046D271B|nr:hypothetical protein [Rhodococcus opacus]
MHGLLAHDTAPYKMRLGEPGSVTADTVYEQAAAAQGLLDSRTWSSSPAGTAATSSQPRGRTPGPRSRAVGEQQQRLAHIAAIGVAAIDAAESHPRSA